MDGARIFRFASCIGLAVAVISTAGFYLDKRNRPKTYSYYRDVAPIVSRRCARCHSGEGLAARPRLDSYDEVSRFARNIKVAAQSRMMPPWGADGTGICRTWRDSLWLGAAEVAALVHWEEQSMPRGDPSERPAREPDAPPVLDRVDATLDTGFDYTPGLGSSGYRCFVVDPELARERLLSGIRVTSTDPRMVAHVEIFSPDSDAAEGDALKLDRDDPAPGYSCYGSPRIAPARLIASWTWDSPALPFPPGTGLRLSAHRKLIVQIHYNIITSGLGATTRTHIAMKYDDHAREASLISLSAGDFALAAGKTYAEASGERTVDRPMTILGAAPHMHTLGQTMQVDHLHGGSRDCAASFDHWNFYRQRLFFYDEPLHVDVGDRLRVSCIYNTLNSAQPVHRGESIRDEECTANLYVTFP